MKPFLKPFVCVVEDYDGNKKNVRVFANTAVQAREKLIQKYPKCYVSPAMTMKEYAERNGENHG